MTADEMEGVEWKARRGYKIVDRPMLWTNDWVKMAGKN